MGRRARRSARRRLKTWTATICRTASRLREVADKELNANKRAVLEKLSFGSLLKIRPFSVPLELIDWVVMRIDTKHSLFSRKKKTIVH